MSVVIPAFNDERFIDACLESVQRQDWLDVEIVVVDDAGTDGTAEIVRRRAAADPRIRLLEHETNLGLASSRNTGIAHAQGEFVTFLDADDFLIGERSISARVAAAEDLPPAVVGSYCGWMQVPEDAPLDVEVVVNPPSAVVGFVEARGENPFIATAPLLRRSAVIAVGGFDEDLRTGEDFDFWTRILRQGFRLVPAPVVGVAYRQKRGGMIAEGPAEHALAARKVYDFLARPMALEEICAGAPAPFVAPLPTLQHDRRWILRLAQFAVFAEHSADDSAVSRLLDQLPATARVELLQPAHELDDRLDAALRRCRLRDPSLDDARALRIRAAALAKLVSAVESVPLPGAAELAHGTSPRVGSLDLAACRGRVRHAPETNRVPETPGVGIAVICLTGQAEHADADMAAFDRVVVCLAPEAEFTGESRARLDAASSGVTVLQARARADLDSLAALALVALRGQPPSRVFVDRFAGEAETDEEARLRSHLQSEGRATESALVVIPVDHEGQMVDARRHLERLGAAGREAAILDLGPLADIDAAISPDALTLRHEFDVKALAVVYPYGPYVSNLVTVAVAAGLPVHELESDWLVDRVDGAGAALAPDALPSGDETEAVPWSRLFADVAKPWMAVNIEEVRSAQAVGTAVHRRRLEGMRDRHRGERCVVIGNGPSLNAIDLSLLADEVTFGVNGIFLAEETMGFATTYYMVEDSLYMKENVQDVLLYNASHKFFPSEYRTYFDEVPENVSFFEMDGRFYSGGSPAHSVPRFSTDFSRRGYCGQSVTILNLQLAYHLGFAEVVLIGMDFSYTIPDSVIREGNHLTSTEDDPNHFHPGYFGVGRTWKDPKLDRVLASYQLAKRVFEQDGRRIVNATAGGALELFPRSDYGELFGRSSRPDFSTGGKT
ncbi:MAG: glycosyltransferase [Acidimicrobiales bacterium]